MKKKLLLSVLAAGLLVPTSFASAKYNPDMSKSFTELLASVQDSELEEAIAFWGKQPKDDREKMLPTLNKRLAEVKAAEKQKALNAKLAKALSDLEAVKKEVAQMKEARQKAAENAYNYGKEKKAKEAELAKIQEKLNGKLGASYSVAIYPGTELTFKAQAAKLEKEIANLKNTIAVAENYAKYDREKEKALKEKEGKIRELIRDLRAQGAKDPVKETPKGETKVPGNAPTADAKPEGFPPSGKTEGETYSPKGFTGEAGKTEAGKTEAGKTEVGKTEAGKAKPAAKTVNKAANKVGKKALPKTSAVK